MGLAQSRLIKVFSNLKESKHVIPFFVYTVLPLVQAGLVDFLFLIRDTYPLGSNPVVEVRECNEPGCEVFDNPHDKLI